MLVRRFLLFTTLLLAVTHGCKRSQPAATESAEKTAQESEAPVKPTVTGEAPAPATAPFDAAQAEAHQLAWAAHLGVPVEHTASAGIKLRLIPPGDFLMGSPESEQRRDTDEQQREIHLAKALYVGVHEVTQLQYWKLIDANPSAFSPDGTRTDDVGDLVTMSFPVETVSWFDAIDFCNKLSEKDGLTPYYGRLGTTVTIRDNDGYRLPTEEEWEFACRAGTTTPFSFGATCDGNQANCDGRYPYGTTTKGPALKRSAEVGSYAANAFGLYDMHGNVWEWCQDWYDADKEGVPPTRRVLRGGSFDDNALSTRAAFRLSNAPADRDMTIGFRVVRTLNPR